MAYKYGARSERCLKGVHPDLVRVARRALEISETDMAIIDGVRTIQRQKQLFDEGKSMTMNSRHLLGQALDIVPWPLDWEDTESFEKVARAMKDAADDLEVDITWGGDWASFADLPHYQIEGV